MKQAAKKLIKHPLIYGSTIVVFGGILANFFNFLFNLFMSRTLPVTDYGILATIISLITFPTLIVTAVNPVIIRFAGVYFAKNEQMLLRGLYIKFFKFLLFVGVIVFLLILLFIRQIGNFLHITNYFILLFTDIIILISFVNIINLSFLQAKLAFSFQVIVNLIGTVTKFLCGLLLVFLGYSVTGATGAIVISSLAAYVFSFLPMKFLLFSKIKSPDIDTKELFRYGIPSALALLGLISFISSDIILVKHFFSPAQAGLYAGLSLVGRVPFFISAPIGTVMFPIIVQKHAKGLNFSNTFKLSIGLMLIPSIFLTLFYFLFPVFSVLFFLKRPEYISITPLLGLFGLYITLYCTVYLFANFYLSIKKTTIYGPILIVALLQIILINFYHQSFFQIIIISFMLVLLLMIGFLIYYPYATRK